MVRTQIQLSEEQHKALRDMAAQNRLTVAEIIRRAVDQLLLTRKPDRSALYRQAKTVVGKFRSETPDIASDHDRFLEEDFR